MLRGLRAKQDGPERIDGSILHAGEDVGIGVERDAGLSVPEPLTHDFERLTGREEQRRVTMPEVVNADLRDASLGNDRVEVAVEIVGVEQLPVARGEDKIVR